MVSDSVKLSYAPVLAAYHELEFAVGLALKMEAEYRAALVDDGVYSMHSKAVEDRLAACLAGSAALGKVLRAAGFKLDVKDDGGAGGPAVA